jgi:GNAT superfamily N-acetyltransferase
MEHGGLDAFIDDLYVRPAHRRAGLGRAGLEALFAECRRRGVLAVHVEVGDDNVPARALYGSFGLAPRTDRRVLLTTTLGRAP